MPEHDSTALHRYKEIVASHEAAVRAFVAVRLNDPFEAHDIAQEVFLCLWRKFGELDLTQPLRAWLLAVAANLVRQHRRKGRAIPVGDSDAVSAFLDSRIELGPATDGNIFIALEECLQKLGEGPRRLIEWRYAEGMGIREIGLRTTGKHSAVTMKLHRLRALLMECIGTRMKEEAA